jgi:hypothetical protein
MIDRLNRLDERTGADRVGQGMRLYGIFVAWPVTLVGASVAGVLNVLRGDTERAVASFVFAGLAGLLLIFGVRAEKSYRRYKASQNGAGDDAEPPMYDVR